MKSSNLNNDKDGKIFIDYINKNTVYIELDDKGCKYLIDILSDMLNNKKVHHIDLEASTMYSLGVFAENSLSLMINHRDKDRYQ